MTTITIIANPTMLAGHIAAIKAIQQGNYPPRLKVKKKRASLPRTAPLNNSPTPQRLEKAGDLATKTLSPPSTTVIESTYQKFRDRLGPESVMVLDRLYELAQSVMSSRGLTAAYSGMTVDSSRQDAVNMTERQRLAHEEFRRIWAALGPDMQRLASELVLELPISPIPTKNGSMAAIQVVGDRVRSYAAIGRELCGYNDDRRGMGAAVGALKILSWRVRELMMGGVMPARRLARA